mmetsp:Transcript_3859/g.9278  ORF Transcript_3859/g.9278 Transcript_3859/m.9278 type:complete len:277 (-) Transcript_3859:895-1725(-)
MEFFLVDLPNRVVLLALVLIEHPQNDTQENHGSNRNTNNDAQVEFITLCYHGRRKVVGQICSAIVEHIISFSIPSVFKKKISNNTLERNASVVCFFLDEVAYLVQCTGRFSCTGGSIKGHRSTDASERGLLEPVKVLLATERRGVCVGCAGGKAKSNCRLVVERGKAILDGRQEVFGIYERRRGAVGRIVVLRPQRTKVFHILGIVEFGHLGLVPVETWNPRHATGRLQECRSTVGQMQRRSFFKGPTVQCAQETVREEPVMKAGTGHAGVVGLGK